MTISAGAIARYAQLAGSQPTTTSVITVPDAFVIEDVETATYTIAALDVGKLKRFTNATGCVVTVDATLPADARVHLLRDTAGSVTVVSGTATVTVAAGAQASLQQAPSQATLYAVTQTAIVLVGDLIRDEVFPITEIVTTATYTIVTSDRGKVKRFTNAGSVVVTVPDSVLASDDLVYLENAATGAVTIVGGGTMVVQTAPCDIAQMIPQPSFAALRVRSATAVILFGGLESSE